jgi:hypothetical protein
MDETENFCRKNTRQLKHLEENSLMNNRSFSLQIQKQSCTAGSISQCNSSKRKCSRDKIALIEAQNAQLETTSVLRVSYQSKRLISEVFKRRIQQQNKRTTITNAALDGID